MRGRGVRRQLVEPFLCGLHLGFKLILHVLARRRAFLLQRRDLRGDLVTDRRCGALHLGMQPLRLRMPLLHLRVILAERLLPSGREVGLGQRSALLEVGCRRRCGAVEGVQIGLRLFQVRLQFLPLLLQLGFGLGLRGGRLRGQLVVLRLEHRHPGRELALHLRVGRRDFLLPGAGLRRDLSPRRLRRGGQASVEILHLGTPLLLLIRGAFFQLLEQVLPAGAGHLKPGGDLLLALLVRLSILGP
jgi:hypothetical protein